MWNKYLMKIVLQHLAPTDQLNRPKLSLSCQLGATGSILIRYLSTHPSIHSKTLKLKIDLTLTYQSGVAQLSPRLFHIWSESQFQFASLFIASYGKTSLGSNKLRYSFWWWYFYCFYSYIVYIKIHVSPIFH